MAYRFIEGLTVADIAFEARGKTLEALFSSAGQAVTAAQLHDLRTIRKKESRTFDLTNKAIDMLLFNFLQELIYWKDVDLLLFKSFDLSIRQKADGNYHLTGTGQGEPIDVSRHQLRVDVKAVTMHKFEVASDANGWKATVVLDI
ncbi:MAG: archease [Candidatus Manganitrophus sp.]|nr:archease [Candidatus Manganitrophus sp.]WDT70174.1 MAG: archease [Candidatus Manganitrophus sp.]WDT78173.1 MAG: archease [Candidatus Manganitrophus sp.]